MVQSGVANLESWYDCSILFGFQEIAFSLIFFFSKNLDLKKIQRTSISQQFSGVLAGYNQKLQIWSPSMTAENFLVFEMWRFFIIF